MTEAIVTGARCALHPEVTAIGTCQRCGNFACRDCSASFYGSGTMCVTCVKTSVQSRYHVVPTWRFVLFSLLTFGGYELYWFWKTWSKVKRADGSDIWPIPRALFAQFTYFSLLTDINTQLVARGSGRVLDGIERELSSGLAVGFLVTMMAHRLPDPFWLVTLGSFVFVLPAIRVIRELASDAAIAEGAAWRMRHTLLLLVTVPFCVLAAVGLLMGEGAE